MKDWKDSSQYPEKLDKWGWAWEFLRRNPDYQAEFERELEVFEKRRREKPDSYKWIPGEAGDADFAIPPFPLEPPFKSCRWGISLFVNPVQDRPRHLHFIPPGHDVGLVHGLHPDEPLEKINGERRVELTLEPGHVATKIDLTMELTPQFKAAEAYVRAHQESFVEAGVLEVRPFKVSGQLWSSYLRILDAVETGAKMKEIAEVLSKEDPDGVEEKRLTERHRAAKRMREREGYLPIVIPWKEI